MSFRVHISLYIYFLTSRKIFFLNLWKELIISLDIYNVLWINSWSYIISYRNDFSWKMQTTFCQEFRLKKVIKWKAAKSNVGHFMTYTMYFLKSKKLRKLGVVRVAFKIDLIDISIMLHLSKVSKVMFLCKTYFVLLNNP